MIVSAWTNGKGSYGIRVAVSDRRTYFDPAWETVILEFHKSVFEHEVNINTTTFRKHGIIVSVEVKLWMEENKVIPWIIGFPTKLTLEPRSNRRFLLMRLRKESRGQVSRVQW